MKFCNRWVLLKCRVYEEEGVDELFIYMDDAVSGFTVDYDPISLILTPFWLSQQSDENKATCWLLI